MLSVPIAHSGSGVAVTFTGVRASSPVWIYFSALLTSSRKFAPILLLRTCCAACHSTRCIGRSLLETLAEFLLHALGGRDFEVFQVPTSVVREGPAGLVVYRYFNFIVIQDFADGPTFFLVRSAVMDYLDA